MKRSKLLIPAIVIAILMSIGLITVFASPIILVTPISGTVSEADLNQIATFDLTLEDAPTADITITIGTDMTTSDGTTPQCVVSSDGVSFTNSVAVILNSSNYSSATTISVAANDDGDLENQHFCNVQLEVTSTGSNYDNVKEEVQVTIEDNESPSASASLIAYPTEISVSEGESDLFWVSFSGPAAPTNDITVSLTPADAAQCGLSSGTLTFTSADWNTPQAVTYTPVDDAAVETDLNCDVSISTASDDANFAGLSGSVSALITDNDTAPTYTAGATVNPTSIAIAEGGATADFTVVLDSAPSDNVVFDVTPDAQCTTSVAQLTFTTGDWNSAQTVNVTAVDDAADESTHTCTVTLSTNGSTAAAEYGSYDPADVTATITDNDTAPTYTAGATVNPTSIAIAEGGATADFTVVLDSAPSDNVVFDVTPDAQCTTSVAQLTFTTGDWNSAQTVNVTAVDDAADESTHTCTVTLSTNGSTAAAEYGSYDPADVTATITDNDTPTYTAGATVNPTSIAIAEGGATADFTVVLDSAPSGDVVFDVTPDTQCTTSVAQLTFTTSDWSSAQTVTVTAVDDAADESTHTCTVTLSTNGSTAAAEYGSYDPADVTATITDNDAITYTAGVSVSPTTINVAEGGATDSYDIVLTSEPSSTVVITSAGDGQCTVTSGASLTFNASNWSTPQTVGVSANDDSAVEGVHTCTITVSLDTGNTTAAEYLSPVYDPSDVSGNITDNDSAPVYTAGVSVTPTTINIAEGGSAGSYTLVLNSVPSDNVILNSAATTGQCSVTSGSQVTFTPSNWNVAQTVNVLATDDSDVEGTHTCVIAVSVDGSTPAAEYGSYNPSDVTANITDNDPSYTPGMTVAPTSVNITEGGTQADVGVVLTSPPASNVVVNVASNNTAQCTVSLSSLVFNSSNWNTTQTVRITATDDSVQEADGLTCNVSFNAASSDGNYNGRNATVTASITDNDSPTVQPAIIITETDSSTWVSEAGGTDVFYVSLSTKPTANVELLISTDGQCAVDDTQKTMTQNSWNSMKSIIVSAVNDNVDEADTHTCKISITTIDQYSANEYKNASKNLTVNVTDNDVTTTTPGVIISPASMVINEGATGYVTFSLQSKPAADVLVQAFSSDTNICTVSPAEFTLTSSSYNTGKNFAVTGAYNNSSANLACNVTFRTISADGNYHLISTPTFTTVINNTFAQIATATPYTFYPTYTAIPTTYSWASSTPWATSTSIIMPTSTPLFVTATNTPDPNAPMYTSTPSATATQQGRSGPSAGMIAIIVISTLVLFGGVGVGAYFIIQKYF